METEGKKSQGRWMRVPCSRDSRNGRPRWRVLDRTPGTAPQYLGLWIVCPAYSSQTQTQTKNAYIRFSRSRKRKCQENVSKLHGSMLMYLAWAGGPSGGQRWWPDDFCRSKKWSVVTIYLVGGGGKRDENGKKPMQAWRAYKANLKLDCVSFHG